jgi:hypothetical protein
MGCVSCKSVVHTSDETTSNDTSEKHGVVSKKHGVVSTQNLPDDLVILIFQKLVVSLAQDAQHFTAAVLTPAAQIAQLECVSQQFRCVQPGNTCRQGW